MRDMHVVELVEGDPVSIRRPHPTPEREEPPACCCRRRGAHRTSSRDWIRTSNRPINSRMLCH
jgi:hypothetical protein